MFFLDLHSILFLYVLIGLYNVNTFLQLLKKWIRPAVKLWELECGRIKEDKLVFNPILKEIKENTTHQGNENIISNLEIL